MELAMRYTPICSPRVFGSLSQRGAEGEAVGGRRGGRAGERAVCGASGLQ